MLKGESMFCPRCGAQNPDGAKFCAGCGAPLASRPAQPQSPGAAGLQTQGAPQVPGRQVPGGAYAPGQQQGTRPGIPGQPAYGANSAYAGVAGAPKRGNRATRPLIIVGGAAAAVVVVLLAVFLVAPAITGANARFNGSFEIDVSGSPLTVTGSGNTMTVGISPSSSFFSSSSGGTITGTVDKVAKVDDSMAYKLKDVTYSGDGSNVDELEATIVVPRGASTKNPYGRYAVIVEQVASGSRALVSIVFDYTNDQKAKLTMPFAYGDESTTTHDDLAWADATSSSYDPEGSHDNGGAIYYDLEGSSSGPGSSSFSATGTPYDIEVDFKVTA